MYILRKEMKFSAAHQLPKYDGRCANLHGHTWKVEIEIQATGLDKQDFVVDFTIVKKAIDTPFDHRYLNDVIENPTAENLARYIYQDLKTALDPEIHKKLSVKVWESDTASIEYTEDGLWDED